MHLVNLVLPCLACLGYARRFQASVEQLESQKSEDLLSPSKALANLIFAAAFNPSTIGTRFGSANAGLASSRPATFDARMQLPDFGGVGSGIMEKLGMKKEGEDMSDEDKEALEDRLKSGNMNFEDFLSQTKTMQKTAQIQALIGKFGGGKEQEAQLQAGKEKMMAHAEIVKVMTDEERQDPDGLIKEMEESKTGGVGKAPRLARLAEASGSELKDIQTFIFEFNMMRKAGAKFANGEDPESIRASMLEEQRKAAASGQKGVGPQNRQQRRLQAKQAKKKNTAGGGGGFGRR